MPRRRVCALKSSRYAWADLPLLDKALPAIVRFKKGTYAVLLEVQRKDGAGTVVLQDPRAGDDTLVTFERELFRDLWTGEIILVRRRYDLRDEKQLFDFRFVKNLVFRERRAIRDIAICAFVLGAIALSPILFWRVIIGVVYDNSYNTFNVACLRFPHRRDIRGGYLFRATVADRAAFGADRRQTEQVCVRQAAESSNGFF